jgi:hypothetical protein
MKKIEINVIGVEVTKTTLKGEESFVITMILRMKFSGDEER